ncbi:MAG: secretin N-terminal domain-containing protein [Candidatus Wallbacteria bacterium]|nr:secretin N-terminal domain-containing protein [Candidatus Wallbacteria bacterium]
MKYNSKLTVLIILLFTAISMAVDLDKQTVTMEFKDVDIQTVLQIFVKEKGLNIVAGDDVRGRISVSLNNVTLKRALEAILDVNGFGYSLEGDIVRVFKQGNEHRVNEIVNLQKLDAEQAKNLMASLLGPGGTITADASTRSLLIVDTPDRIRNIRETISSLEGKVIPSFAGTKEGTITPFIGIPNTVSVGKELRIIPIKLGNAAEIALMIKPLLSFDAVILTDEKTNTLFITDRKQAIDSAASVISYLDRKPMQVMIEAKIMEVALSKSDTMGMDWFWHNIMTGVYDAAGNPEDLASLAVKIPAAVLDPRNPGGTIRFGTMDSRNFNMALKALSTKSDAKLLSAPKVATLNNCSAEIEINSRWPKQQQQTTTSAGNAPRDTVTYDFVDVPIKLNVVPKIGEDGFINMQLEIQVDNVVEIVDVATNTPRITSRRTTTMMRVRDGDTIAIGGLIKNDVLNKTSKVPVLGDLPLIKSMFRSTAQSLEKSELIIFITPVIMDTGIDQRDIKVKDALRKKIESSLKDEPLDKSPLRKEEVQKLVDELKSDLH